MPRFKAVEDARLRNLPRRPSVAVVTLALHDKSLLTRNGTNPLYIAWPKAFDTGLSALASYISVHILCVLVLVLHVV